MLIGLRTSGLVAAALLLALGTGCGGGGPPTREDILKIPKEEHYGMAVKAQLFEFRAKVKKRGVKAAQQELPTLLENFDGYEKQALGQHLETYKQIVEKLNALKTTLAGSPNPAEVTQVANEIGELATKLPGKADENPEVE
jgi:hypothetical protein